MKKKTKKRIKNIIIISSISLIISITILTALNIIFRNEIPLNEDYKSELSKVFPENFVNSKFKIYKGGIIPLFSSVTLCKSIYFKPSDFQESINNPLLIHESTHLYQVKEGYLRCISNGVSSLFHQFKAFLLYDSRNYAYLYPLDNTNNIFSIKGYYNPEQEASIIEDYYYLKFQDGNISQINCYACEDYTKKSTCSQCQEFFPAEEIITELEKHYNDILKKYP